MQLPGSSCTLPYITSWLTFELSFLIGFYWLFVVSPK